MLTLQIDIDIFGMNALTFKSDSQGIAAGTSTLKATLLNYNSSQTNQRKKKREWMWHCQCDNHKTVIY